MCTYLVRIYDGLATWSNVCTERNSSTWSNELAQLPSLFCSVRSFFSISVRLSVCPYVCRYTHLYTHLSRPTLTPPLPLLSAISPVHALATAAAAATTLTRRYLETHCDRFFSECTKLFGNYHRCYTCVLLYRSRAAAAAERTNGL